MSDVIQNAKAPCYGVVSHVLSNTYETADWQGASSLFYIITYCFEISEKHVEQNLKSNFHAAEKKRVIRIVNKADCCADANLLVHKNTSTFIDLVGLSAAENSESLFFLKAKIITTTSNNCGVFFFCLVLIIEDLIGTFPIFSHNYYQKGF